MNEGYKNKEEDHSKIKNDCIVMLTFLVFIIFLYRNSLWELFIFSEYNNISKGLYSYIFFIPFISGYFIFQKWEKIFKNNQNSQKDFFISSLFFVLGILPLLFKENLSGLLNKNDYLFTQTIGWIFCMIGAFTFSFGRKAVKEAVFPLGLLFFMAPIPFFILERYIYFLQHFSVDTSYLILKILNIPVLQRDTILQLPNFTMEVADECSGIRSSIVLWLTGVLACYIFLKSNFMRLLLLFSVTPIAIFKNSLRIVTLGILASYVDPIYITNHWIHRSGGILFFVVTLFFIFFPFIFFLKRIERFLLKNKEK